MMTSGADGAGSQPVEFGRFLIGQTTLRSVDDDNEDSVLNGSRHWEADPGYPLPF